MPAVAQAIQVLTAERKHVQHSVSENSFVPLEETGWQTFTHTVVDANILDSVPD